MNIGVPREIKAQEGRVALLPVHVKCLTASGHTVYVESGAGQISGAADAAYRDAGAIVLPGPGEVYAHSTMIVKVKEILEPEYAFLKKEHIIFTTFHAALNRDQVDRMLAVGLVGISAENTHQHGSPNCALAGEIGALEGVRLSLAPHGGTGRHFMAHFGADPSRAVVLGLGHMGRGVLRTVLNLGIQVIGLDISEAARKEALMDWYNTDLVVDEIETLPRYLPGADMIFNCVRWPKEREDHLISRDMLKTMKPTAVIVDISCDTAGAIETCRPTTWADPVYEVEGIRHFCVDNISGSVPVSASAGYGEAILPKIQLIADQGIVAALHREPWLARGLTCADGELILEEAGRFQNRPFTPVDEWLKQHSPE